MAAIIKAGLRTYFTVFHDMRDSRSDDFFLMYSVWQPLAIVAVYLYFVLSFGPQLMKNRPPMKLDFVIKTYDILQLFLSCYIIERCLTLGWGTDYQWFCQPVDYSETPRSRETIRATWAYTMQKLLDLLDTIFFVVRKKNSHVSFLHVYHHAGVFFGVWVIAKFLPGGHGTFLGLVNSVVHIAMYSYYFVTMQWPESKQNIWWKKHITQLQIVQFLLISFHSIPPLFIEDCKYPRIIAGLMVVQYSFFFFLFLDFYRKAYSKKKS